MVERWFPKPDVRGSNPFSPEINLKKMLGWEKWQSGL